VHDNLNEELKMVRIRLRRVGRKKQPHYRIVVADSTSPRDGRFVEIIGHYHPRQAENSLEVQADRANHWLDHGALPSDTVRSLLRRAGILKVRHEARVAKKLQGSAVALKSDE
jgi:small subunit ribosomal protein S16